MSNGNSTKMFPIIYVSEMNNLPEESEKTAGHENTVICLIEAPGAIARLDLIPESKSGASELSNSGFRLKIGQLLRKLSLFQSLRQN